MSFRLPCYIQLHFTDPNKIHEYPFQRRIMSRFILLGRHTFIPFLQPRLNQQFRHRVEEDHYYGKCLYSLQIFQICLGDPETLVLQKPESLLHGDLVFVIIQHRIRIQRDHLNPEGTSPDSPSEQELSRNFMKFRSEDVDLSCSSTIKNQNLVKHHPV